MGYKYAVDQERTKQAMDIIEQVKKYPCLYSKEDVNFRNDVKMEVCFIQIAKDLNLTVVQVKKTWRSLRNAGQDFRKKLCRLSLSEGPVRRPFFRYEKALEFCLQAYPQPSPDCEWVIKQPVPSKPRIRQYSLKGKGKRKRKPSSSSDSDSEEEVDLVDLENDEPKESITTRSRSGGKLYALGKEWRALATNSEDPDGVATAKGKKWQWDERLIQLVRERPVLYDFNLEGQHKQDVQEMNKAWAEIADIIGGNDMPVGVEPVKARWKGLKDQHWAYVKRRRAGNPGRSRLSFSHSDSMEFLTESKPTATDLGLKPGEKLSHRRIRESIKYHKAASAAPATSATPPGTLTSTETLKYAIDSDSIQEMPYEDEGSYHHEDNYDDSPHNMETKNHEASPPNHEAHPYESFVTVAAPVTPVADDIDHYLCSLAPAMRRIHAQNPKKCAGVKIKFMQILAEAEYSE